MVGGRSLEIERCGGGRGVTTIALLWGVHCSVGHVSHCVLSSGLMGVSVERDSAGTGVWLGHA